MNHEQLRKYIIGPTLRRIGLYSPAAENLLALTCATESLGGRYIHQIGGGPAIGPYQMEPNTHDDIWDNFLRYRSGGQYEDAKSFLAKIGAPEPATLAGRFRGLQVPHMCDAENAVEMHWNFAYATAMVRAHYLRVPEPLPNADDIPALARYWKRYYNTLAGAGTAVLAEADYRRFIQQ